MKRTPSGFGKSEPLNFPSDSHFMATVNAAFNIQRSGLLSNENCANKARVPVVLQIAHYP